MRSRLILTLLALGSVAWALLLLHCVNTHTLINIYQGNEEVEIDFDIHLKVDTVDHNQKDISTHITDSKRATSSSSSSIIDEHDKTNLPYMFIHIGPLKTGTTSIQKALGIYQSILHDKDRYDVNFVKNIGRIIIGFGRKNLLNFFLGCVTHSSYCSKTNPEQWSKLLNITSEPGTKEGLNMIISEENLSFSDFNNSDWEEFLSHHKKIYNIQFVMYYRRYFDALPSWYNQQYKYRGMYDKRLSRKWPSEGGVRPQSFPSYFDNRDWPNLIHNMMDEDTGKYPAITLTVKHVIDKLSIPVRIGNFHGKSDAVEDFFCNILPNANHTCYEVKMRSKAIRANGAENPQGINSDLFAVAAKENGLLHPKNTLERFDLNAKILNEGLKNVPLSCLEGEKLEEFRQFSYAAEEELMPSMLDTHDEDFWKAVEKKKFCSVDTEKLILDERWIAFFKSL